jgi:hypothetical protein
MGPLKLLDIAWGEGTFAVEMAKKGLGGYRDRHFQKKCCAWQIIGKIRAYNSLASNSRTCAFWNSKTNLI